MHNLSRNGRLVIIVTFNITKGHGWFIVNPYMLVLLVKKRPNLGGFFIYHYIFFSMLYSQEVCKNVVILLFIRSDFCSVFIQIFFKTAASSGVLRVVPGKGIDKHTQYQ